MSVHRMPRSRVPAPRVVEIVDVEPAANDAHCLSVQRRAVVWTYVLCAVLAAALIYQGRFA